MTNSNLELLQILLDRIEYGESNTEKAATTANISKYRLEEAFDTLKDLIKAMQELNKENK